MRIRIEHGHVVDPSRQWDGPGTILIEDGVIREIRPKEQKSRKPDAGQKEKTRSGTEERIIDAGGCYVFPGLIDMHTHLREPGYEYKETIKTGTLAAVRGGFTSVCSMPNTDPVNDNSSVTDFILRRAIQEGACTVYPIGAITKGQKGEELAEMGIMRAAGCVAFSDDGRPVMNSLVMRRALEYAKAFAVPLISHCEDLHLNDGGVMNEGLLSATMGLRGSPNEAEETMVARDIALAGLTKGRLHVAHVSTAGSVRLIREAKGRGINVTAETCPHYFSVTEDEVRGFNTNAKVNPPLRTAEDIEAIKQGLKDGTIDVIATDHAPHHRDEKLREFDQAPSGISGIETALSLSLGLVREGVLSLDQLVMKMSVNPSVILGLGKGTLEAGAQANLVIVDPLKEYTVSPDSFASKGKNTPFNGWTLTGAAIMTISKGKLHEW